MRRTRKVFVIQSGKPAEPLPEPGPCVDIDAPTEDGLLEHEVIAKCGARVVTYTPTGGVAYSEDSW